MRPINGSDRPGGGCGGAALPPFVFVHGFAQDESSWDETRALLHAAGVASTAIRLVAGRHADGEASVDGSSMETACADVARIVRRVAAHAGAPAVLVGYSMGGRIALETVIRMSDLPLAGLMLESAGTGPVDDAQRAAYATRNTRWADDVRERGVESFMDAWENLPLFASQRDLPDEVRAAVRARRTAHGAEELACLFESVGAHRQTERAAGMRELAHRQACGLELLFVHGSLDVKYAQTARRLALDLPRARTVCVRGAGHDTHLEAPRTFAAVCVEFARTCV